MHNIVQLSPLSVSKPFLSSPNKLCTPKSMTPHLPLLPAPRSPVINLSFWIGIFQVFHIRGTTQQFSFCVRFTAPNITSSGVIHVGAGVRMSFLLKVRSYSIVWIDHNLHVHSPVGRCWGCFRLVPIVNNSAVNMGVQVSVHACVLSSFGCIHRSGVTRSYGSSVINFWKICRFLIRKKMDIF